MKIKPTFVIDALLSRFHRRARVLVDGVNFAVDRECRDLMTELYDADPARVSLILEVLSDMGLCSFNERGEVAVNGTLRRFLAERAD